MEGSNDEQPPQERELPPAPAIAVKPPTRAPRSKWNPLATPKRALLSVLVLLVLSAGVFVGILKLQVPIGHVKWSRVIGPMLNSKPTVSNGVVYIGTNEDKIFALDANSGQVIWSIQVGVFNKSSGLTPTPVVENGMLYLNTPGSLYALDANSGRTIWTYQIYTDTLLPPTVANGVVYVGSFDGVLYALDAVSGRKLWSQESSLHQFDLDAASPAVAQGLVYVATDDGITVLDAASGQEQWTIITDSMVNTPTIVNGVVYLTTLDGVGELEALDAHSGRFKWIGDEDGFGGSPIVAGNPSSARSLVGVSDFLSDST